METQFIATAKSAKGMQEAIAIRPLSAFSSQASIASERMRILSTMFKQGTTQLINFGKNVQWAGRQLMVGFTVPLTIFGGLATKVFRELEKEAVNFKKVYGDIFTTDVEVEKNLDAVKELAKEFTKYGIAAKNTMELAALAAQSGKQGVELQQATIQATRLATLGDIERQQAMRATIALQSAFRMSNEELANSINFLNIVENSSVVSLQNLVEAIPRVAPVIVGLGGDVKDMAVFLAAMQEGGVNAAEAANGLKSSLGRLISPTKQAKEMANEFGLSLEKIVEVNEGNVLGMVTTLSEAMKQLSDLQKQQLLSAVFGKFQFARMGALFENITREGSQASKIIEMMDMSIEDMAATADKELSAIEQSVGTQLTGAIERLKLEIAPIGELFAKMAIPIVNWLGKIAEWFNGLSDSRKQLLAWGTLIGGVIIPAGTMLFGLLMNLVGTFAKLTQGVGIFTTALVKGGPLGALKAVTQSTKYLSLEEIDAANAARQFGSATNFANEALVRQAGLAKTTSAAIAELTALYRIFAQEQARAAGAQQVVFGTGAVAAGLARRPSRIKSIGLNDGGEVYNINQGNVVPGVGNTDTVPAMLTPGEFVINKQSTKENMPILEAINNGQRLNKGGKVKNNLLYAMAGTLVPKLGPEFIPATGGLFAPIAKSAARRKQSSRTREEIPEGTILKKLNNFVYLLEPNANQQLIGNKIMSGFGSKRGVPLNTLKSQYLSDEGMWMIDAYSGGKWAKTAYRETLKRNFDNIAARYPGKEVRFLDQDGMGRVKDFINSPGYENIQFVSTRELHNKELFSRLTKEHRNRLFSKDTASQMQNRLRSSTGNMENRPTYVDLNSSSYTKRAKSWRGSQRPKGKQAAHVFNMGGMVPVQNFSLGGVAKAISALRPKFGKKDMPILEKMYFREFPKVVEGARLNDAMALRQMGFSLDDINNLFNSSGYFANNILDLKPIQKKLFAEASSLKPSAIRVKTSGKTGADLRWPMLKSQKERANVSNFLKEKGVIGEETSALAFKSRGDRSHFSDVEILKQVKSKNPYSIEGYFSQASLEPREFNKIYARMGLGSPRSAKELEQQRKIFAGILGQEYVSLKNISTVENVSKNVRSPRGWNELMADFGLSRNKGGMIKLNKGGLVPKAVAEHIRNKYPQMSPAIREIVENYVKKTRSNYATMYTRSSEFNTSIDQIMREVGRYGEKHVVNRLGKSFNFNTGNIVPGVGNTDTVPAMLTPGEFVVNKDSTKENLALLHSINDGGITEYNKGGRVKNGILYAQFGADTGRRSASEISGRYKSIYGKPKPAPVRGAGAFGLAAGLAGTLPLMSQGAVETLGPTGSMVASFAGFFAAQKAATVLYNKLGSGLSKGVASTSGVGKAVDSLKKSIFRTNLVFRAVLIPALGPIAAIAISTVGVFTAFGKTMEKIRKSGEEFNNAMYGSSASLQNMAKSVGRMTPSEQIARQRAETLSGARATQEDVEFSSKFMQTEESKQLIKDLETVKKMGGDQAEALRNQLGQAVLSGIFTPEEAKQIAVDVGLALKNENLSVSAVAQLTDLFGPDGKKLQNNRLEILTEISAPEDIETIVQQSERELERIQKAHFRFWEKGTGYDSALAFQKFFMMFEPDKEALQLTMQMNALQNNIIQNLEKEKQLRSQIQLELQNGTISLDKYNKEINLLNKKTSVDSITNAIKATGISEEELSRLKFNAPAGAIGTGVLGTGIDPFKTLGGMRYGGIEANKGLSREAQQVENLIERLKDSLKIDLEASGFTEDEITSILKNSSESFGNNLEEQAYLFGKILSGEIDAAVFGMIDYYRDLDPAFSEGLTRLAEREGYVTRESVTIPARSVGRGVVPARTEEMVTDRSAEFGTDLLSPFKNAPGLSAAVRSSVAGNQAPGQGIAEDPIMYAKRLTTAYQTIQALPKDLVFALKLDVDSPIDIFKYNGQDIESFKRNWNVLDGLDPALDKTFVFNAIGVDSNGKPRPIDDLIQDTKAVNKAIEDLNSGDKKVVAEAELKLFTLLNQNSDMTSEQIENELNTLKESYKDIWDSVDAGTKSSILLFTALVNGLDPVKDAEAIKALEQQIQSLVDLARVQTTDDDKETGAAKESAFQKIMKSTKATKDYMKAVAGLVKTGLKPENIALIDQADLLEMSVAERKKAIKAVKEQMNIQKALEYLMKSTSERRIFDLEREVKVYDRNIELIERQIEDVEKLNKVEQDRIETLSRQNEMDQRQLAIRSRGLELLSRKEDEVNKVYDARAEALDKVSEINERVARQQQSRISLATALTSGDIAGAASAAAQMAAQYAQDQEEDARKALESQRQRELENLAVSINGVLMTRSQIEAQILQINDRIYDRNLEIEKLEDIIYHRKETLVKPLEEDINRIMEDRKVKIREIEDLQFKNWQSEMNRVDQLIAKYKDLNTIKGGGSGGGSSSGGSGSSNQNSSKTTTTAVWTPPSTITPSKPTTPVFTYQSGNAPSPLTRRDLKAFGGPIKKYAMGGSVGFRGSREAPPAIKMAIGDVVPGLGNTDRVPALLTPGEFVVRKSVAAENMGLLKSLNGDVFPNIKQDDVMADPSAGQSISSSINNMPIYNSYSVNVNVPNTNASPEEIANAVMSRIQRSATATIRTTRR
jgi:TP901 family phage tail tape measure protein